MLYCYSIDCSMLYSSVMAIFAMFFSDTRGFTELLLVGVQCGVTGECCIGIVWMVLCCMVVRWFSLSCSSDTGRFTELQLVGVQYGVAGECCVVV